MFEPCKVQNMCRVLGGKEEEHKQYEVNHPRVVGGWLYKWLLGSEYSRNCDDNNDDNGNFADANANSNTVICTSNVVILHNKLKTNRLWYIIILGTSTQETRALQRQKRVFRMITCGKYREQRKTASLTHWRAILHQAIEILEWWSSITFLSMPAIIRYGSPIRTIRDTRGELDDNKPFTEQIVLSEEKRNVLEHVSMYICYWNPLILTDQIHFETIHWNNSNFSKGEGVNSDHHIWTE